MTGRTEADLRHLIKEGERLWNERDRDGWLRLWRAAVPGEHVIEMPTGSEPRRGFDAARVQVWDQSQPCEIRTHQLIVCGDSIAALSENINQVNGERLSVFSIDVYDFDDSGNCYERSYFSIPDFWPPA
jgi:hypothetical protein